MTSHVDVCCFESDSGIDVLESARDFYQNLYMEFGASHLCIFRSNISVGFSFMFVIPLLMLLIFLFLMSIFSFTPMSMVKIIVLKSCSDNCSI